MKNETQNSDFLTTDLSSIGRGNGGGANKSKIDADIYEAVCIGVCDAGISTKTYQGKDKQVQNAVLVWQIDYVNGFGSQSIVTDWIAVSGHENSNFMKNFVVPAKLKIKSIGDLIGKSVRVEIDHNDQGYPVITRYFASKKAIDVVDGLYIPTWIINKGYPLRKHTKVLDGARPVTPKTESTGKADQSLDVANSTEAANSDDLPF